MVITLVGAGVIGLAIAARLAGPDREVYVLERNDTFGLESSSRNSETVHAGIYYGEGSLKAKTCVAGNSMLYELCQREGIGYIKTGKLVVATGDEQLPGLEALLQRGERNGVEGLRMLSRKDIEKLEPNVKGVAALLAPSSGVVDSHALMRHFLTKAKDGGAQVAYRSKVVGIERVSEGYEVAVQSDSGTFIFKTQVLINCAGLHSEEIAGLAGLDTAAAGYRLFYCKGEYFSVSGGKGSLVQRLIYPVPDLRSGGTGIHTVLDIERRLRLGPNARYVADIDYKVDAAQKRVFYEAVKPFLPFIEYEDLEPETAGIRPKLQGPGQDPRDFVIRHEADKGLAGFINLLGIESPGLTSSPAIADYVEDLVKEIE